MKKQTLTPVAFILLTLLVSFSAGAATMDVSNSNDEMNAETMDRENDSTLFGSTFSLPTEGMDLSNELASRIIYPEKAITQGIEGEVRVLCTVDSDGKVTDVTILKDVGGDCALAAAKAVRKIDFKPALQNGYPRPFTMVIPVHFNLEF